MHIQKEQEQNKRRATDGQIDPKTPSPRRALGKHASKNWSNTPSQRPHELHECNEKRALTERKQVTDGNGGDLHECSSSRSL
jgi:hypothetical protein